MWLHSIFLAEEAANRCLERVVVRLLGTPALFFSSERHCVCSQRLNGDFLDSSLAN